MNRYSHQIRKISIVPHRKPYTVDPEGNPGAHFLHDTSRTRPPTGPRPRGCAPLTPAGRYAWIHIHTPEPDFFRSAAHATCALLRMVPTWGRKRRSRPHHPYNRRRLRPGGTYGCGPCPWRPSERSCTSLVAPAGRKREPERAQRQSDDENEAKRSRVRGLMAAAHLRRRPGRHPAGCGGGGARPPTHWPLSAAPTAWERPRTVATAEPHIGTCDRYMICSHAGRPRQARAFRRPSRASSRPSRRAPTPARRRTAARGGPRVHRKTGRYSVTQCFSVPNGGPARDRRR